MNILAIDASNASCSVALYDQHQYFTEELHAPRQQTQLLLPMVDKLLSQADISIQKLDAIAYNRGPGSFTGVRLTASVVQGLAFAAKLNVLPVSALHALAYQYYLLARTEYIVTCLDARKNEIYYAFYHVKNGLPVLQGEEKVGAAESITMPENINAPEHINWSVVGDGAVLYEQGIKTCLPQAEIVQPELPYTNAHFIVQLAAKLYSLEDVKSPEQALPIYIRDNVTG